MSSLLAAIQAAREGSLDALTDAIPYTRFMGIRAELVDGELRGKLSFSDHLVGNPAVPALHGGTIGSLLESTAIFQILWSAETLTIPKTINLTVDYLRSARLMDTYAVGTITKHGRRVVNVRVEAWQEDRTRPVSTANAHFLIRPADVES